MSWSLAHIPWRLWHLTHCLPVHPRSFAKPDGFNVHAGSPAAPWPLGSLSYSTLMTHLHVATVTYSNSYNLYHTLPGELDWNLSPLSLNTTFQPLAFSLPCSQEGWSFGLLRLPVPYVYSFFTHWLLISLLLFLTRLDSTLLHLYSTKWSPPCELFSWLRTYTLSPSSTPTKYHRITHLL